MFQLVNAAESKRYRSDCSAILTNVCAMLKRKGISANFTFVGSGARNLVTRNGNGPFDLNYNLEIVKLPAEYQYNLRHLKDTIRVLLDQATGLICFSESQDSTSCLTAILHFKDSPAIEFSFDVAIVKRNFNGILCRLIHNKNVWGPGCDQYVWNEIPSSHDIAKRVREIKAEGLWFEVRDRYIELKNMYLSRPWDKDHPSFIVYVEAVNQVYDKTFR